MNQEQADFFKMVRSVATTCDTHLSVIDTRTALRENYDELIEFIERVVELHPEQAASIAGAARQKEEIKQSLQENCSIVSLALSALASRTKNAALQALVCLTDSNIERLREDKLEAYAAIVYREAFTHKPSLVPSRLTEADIMDLKTDIEAFKEKADAPKVAKGERKAKTADLKALMKEGRNLLENEMDKLVRGLKKSAPEFVAAYTNARIVYDTGTKSKKAPEGAVAKPA